LVRKLDTYTKESREENHIHIDTRPCLSASFFQKMTVDKSFNRGADGTMGPALIL
jgi:hypothetical protein